MTKPDVDEACRRALDRRRCLAAMAAMPFFAIGVPGTASAAAMKRVAILARGERDETLAGFASGMRKVLAELGWIEGKTLEIMWRFLEGDEARAPALARELVRVRPDVIMTRSTACTRAMQQATSAIPIVTAVGDPVGAGFAQSLARPGGNITGLSFGTSEVAQKRLSLLRAVLPKLRTVAILDGSQTRLLEEIAGPIVAASEAAGVATRLQRVESLAQIEAVFEALPSEGRGAAFLFRNLPGLDRAAILQAAIRRRVPTMTDDQDLVKAGALIAYSLQHDDPAGREAAILDKLLRGANPGAIPFEFPKTSRFSINRRTAAAIGVRFPADFLLQADEVIG